VSHQQSPDEEHPHQQQDQTKEGVDKERANEESKPSLHVPKEKGADEEAIARTRRALSSLSPHDEVRSPVLDRAVQMNEHQLNCLEPVEITREEPNFEELGSKFMQLPADITKGDLSLEPSEAFPDAPSTWMVFNRHFSPVALQCSSSVL
jgi:hypothetical protein